jgi:hypothetical protein
MSNLLWGPVSTAWDASLTKEVMMTCPMWNHSGGQLNVKFLRATVAKGEEFACTRTRYCVPGNATEETRRHVPPVTQQPIGFTQASLSLMETDLSPDRQDPCDQPYMRPAPLDQDEMDYEVVVTPNPAQDFVSVITEQQWRQDEQVTVVLTDLAGKQVAPLYKGVAAGLSRIALPGIAHGAYLLRITQEDGRFTTRPLLIGR